MVGECKGEKRSSEKGSQAQSKARTTDSKLLYFSFSLSPSWGYFLHPAPFFFVSCTCQLLCNDTLTLRCAIGGILTLSSFSLFSLYQELHLHLLAISLHPYLKNIHLHDYIQHQKSRERIPLPTMHCLFYFLSLVLSSNPSSSLSSAFSPALSLSSPLSSTMGAQQMAFRLAHNFSTSLFRPLFFVNFG